MFKVYAVYNQATQNIYIGQTQNLSERLKRHNGLLPNKAKSYTSKNKRFGKWKLVHIEHFDTRTEAKLREKQLKTAKGREFLWNKIRVRSSVG